MTIIVTHILKMGEEGEKFLIRLSAMGISKSPEGVLAVVCHQFFLNQQDLKEGEGKFNQELE
jgi:hypothetical protein